MMTVIAGMDGSSWYTSANKCCLLSHWPQLSVSGIWTGMEKPIHVGRQNSLSAFLDICDHGPSYLPLFKTAPREISFFFGGWDSETTIVPYYIMVLINKGKITMSSTSTILAAVTTYDKWWQVVLLPVQLPPFAVYINYLTIPNRHTLIQMITPYSCVL